MSSLTRWKIGLREILRYFWAQNPWIAAAYFLFAIIFTLKGYNIGGDLDATLSQNFALQMHCFAWSFGLVGAFAWFLVGPAAIYLIGTKK